MGKSYTDLRVVKALNGWIIMPLGRQGELLNPAVSMVVKDDENLGDALNAMVVAERLDPSTADDDDLQQLQARVAKAQAQAASSFATTHKPAKRPSL